MTTATALTKCVLVRIEKQEMLRNLRDDPGFSKMFLSRILARVSETQISLADQIFSSTEKRLARLLLLLADGEGSLGSKSISAQITQEVLAVIVGTTRPRVNHFMNKFRDLGFIQYDDHIEVFSSLQYVLKEGADGWAEIPDFEFEQRLLYAQCLIDVVEFISELNHNRAAKTEAPPESLPIAFKPQPELFVWFQGMRRRRHS
jgi:hypothetical protein